MTLLEPLSADHVLGLVRAANESRETYAYTNVPVGELDMQRYVRDAWAGKYSGTTIPFATTDQRTGRIVGSTRFANIEFWDWPQGNPNRHRPHLPDTVEIGWTWLAASAQRTGINTEAKLIMLTFAFETWGVHRVAFRTDIRNERSRTAIVRVGAQFDGVLRRAQLAHDGFVRDTAIYSILGTEWADTKTKLQGQLRL